MAALGCGASAARRRTRFAGPGSGEKKRGWGGSTLKGKGRLAPRIHPGSADTPPHEWRVSTLQTSHLHRAPVARLSATTSKPPNNRQPPNSTSAGNGARRRHCILGCGAHGAWPILGGRAHRAWPIFGRHLSLFSGAGAHRPSAGIRRTRVRLARAWALRRAQHAGSRSPCPPATIDARGGATACPTRTQPCRRTGRWCEQPRGRNPGAPVAGREYGWAVNGLRISHE
eukprot:scaffold883_cov128-Isochrysis_galbana.AAC.2